MSLPPPRKTSWAPSSHRKKGPSTSKGVEGPSGASSRAASNTGMGANVQGHVTVVVPPPRPEVNILNITTVVERDPIQVLNLEESSGTPTESTAPLERKRKSEDLEKSKETERSSSKKSRREPHHPPSLPASIFDPNFNVVAHSSLRAGPSQRAVIEGMSRDDMLSAALEFTIRGAMMILNVREFDRRQSNLDVNRQLSEERKANDALRVKLEVLTLDHQGCSERNDRLQADLDEAHRQLAEAKEDLKTSRALGETLS